jgi:hypothetical protein
MRKSKEVQLSFRADRLRSFIAALLAMAYFLCAGGVAWADTCRTDHIIQIIHSGQSAPMQESLLRRFGGFSAPKINDHGDIAFGGFIRGTGVVQSNDNVLWLRRHDDSLRPLAREGTAAPGGGPNFRYTRVGAAMSLNNDGLIAFRGDFANPGGAVASGGAIWRSNEQDEFELVARTGVQPPGLSNAAVFSGTMESPAFNDSGATAFTGQFNDPQITPQQIRGVWSDFGGGNGLELIAYSGQNIPGTQTPLDLGQNDDFFLSEDGDLAWISIPQSPLDDQAIITKPRGEPWRVIARGGDTMPTIHPAAVISGVGASDINASGQLAVHVRVDGGPCSGCTYIGVMSIEGDFRVAARRNLTAPGTQGRAFVELGRSSVDESGRIAFTATTTGTTAQDSGLWMESSPGDLRLIAREGEVPPGVDSGLVYGHFGTGIGAPAFNGAGQMAFMRNLTEPGSNITAGRGIWIHDEVNGVRPVIVTGDMLPDQFGILREVIELGVPFVQGSAVGEGSWINRRGQVIFLAILDNDSSGIFVSNLAVPEPSSIGALCGAALVCVVARQRGRKRRIAS